VSRPPHTHVDADGLKVVTYRNLFYAGWRGPVEIAHLKKVRVIETSFARECARSAEEALR
jgi:hypothetical protein